MRTCERCDRANPIERDGKLLCLPCWVEEIGRRKPTGTQERVRRDRERRDRFESAYFDPAQRAVAEFGGVSH